MNVELLLKVKEQILREPKRFDMSWWFDGQDALMPIADFQKCGTAACIAGWTLALTRKRGTINWYTDEILYNNKETYVSNLAAKELRLNDEQRKSLFDVLDWEQPYKGKFYLAQTKLQEAKIAAAYIDHFIAKYSPVCQKNVTR